MKLVCFFICLIFLLQSVYNKVKYSNEVCGRKTKCHGIHKRDCANQCGSISNIESCFVTDDKMECNCLS